MLFRSENRTERKVYEDYVLLSFTLPDPLSFDEFCTELGESFGTIELYRHIRSADTDYGHSICAYQEPGTGVMFQLCATTNSNGVITDADVKVFFSMERMLVELRDTLRRVSMQSNKKCKQLSPSRTLHFSSAYHARFCIRKFFVYYKIIFNTLCNINAAVRCNDYHFKVIAFFP